MKVTVLFFAMLQEKLKRSEMSVEVSEGGESLQQLTARVMASCGVEATEVGHCLFAVNWEYVPSHHIVRPGDEVALIPPVAGG